MSSLSVSAAEVLPVQLVRWFEARLHESVGFCLRGCRLYGLEVIDPVGLESGDPLAARVSFIVEAADRESVLREPDAHRVGDFDAAALVSIEWRSVATSRPRPGEYAPRRRARVVDVLCADVGVTAIRFENDPEYIVLSPAS